MVTQEPVTVPDEYLGVVNPHHHQPDHRRKLSNEVAPGDNKGSRSRERAPPHVPPHAGQQPQPAAPPPGEQQIQPLAIQGADEESATVELQSRVSDRARSPQREESLQEQSQQKQKGKKTMTEVEEAE